MGTTGVALLSAALGTHDAAPGHRRRPGPRRFSAVDRGVGALVFPLVLGPICLVPIFVYFRCILFFGGVGWAG